MKNHRNVTSRVASGLAVTALAAGLAGCGGGGPAVSTGASRQLNADVNRLQSAAGSRNAAAVDSAATALRAHVAAQQQAGQLTSSRASAILAQLSQVLADTTVTGHTATKASPTPTPAPAAPRPQPTKANGGKHGDGRDGKGGGEGD